MSPAQPGEALVADQPHHHSTVRRRRYMQSRCNNNNWLPGALPRGLADDRPNRAAVAAGKRSLSEMNGIGGPGERIIRSY